MNKKTIIGLIIAVLVVGGIWYFASNNQQKTSEATKINIGYLPITACLPYFVGQGQGYFASEGLNVEPVRFETSQQMMDALLQGQIDVITSVASAVGLLAEEKNPGKFKVFGMNTNGTANPLDVLIVKIDSNINNVKDLKGKKIGSFPGIYATTMLKKYLRDNGLNPDKDVLIQEMKQDLHLQALASGQIDAVLTFEPNATIGEQKKISKTLIKAPFAIASVDPTPSGLFAISKAFIDTNPQGTEKLIRAFDKSMQYVNDNQVEAKKIMPKYFPIDEGVATMVPIPHFDILATINKDEFQKFTAVLFEEGVIKKSPNLSNFLYSPITN